MADLKRIPKHSHFSIFFYFRLDSHLIFQPVKPGPDGHWLDVPLPVDTVVVAARLAEGLVKAALELLYVSRKILVFFSNFGTFFKKKPMESLPFLQVKFHAQEFNFR